MISHDFVPTLTVKDVKVTKPPAQNSVGILVPGLGVGWSATVFLQHLASTTSVDILPSPVRHNAHTFMVVPSPDLCLRHGCLCSPHDGFANVTACNRSLARFPLAFNLFAMVMSHPVIRVTLAACCTVLSFTLFCPEIITGTFVPRKRIQRPLPSPPTCPWYHAKHRWIPTFRPGLANGYEGDHLSTMGLFSSVFSLANSRSS